MAASACQCRSWKALLSPPLASDMPMLTRTGSGMPISAKLKALISSRQRCAISIAAAAVVSIRKMANSSPPRRKTCSPFLKASVIQFEIALMTSSPTWWPWVSLIDLNRLISNNMKLTWTRCSDNKSLRFCHWSSKARRL